MDWTEAQRETIETRDKNILVSASAGSGKTAVLIERIKQLIVRDKTDIDRFLITTFSNAAAAEMKERLEDAIRNEMEKEDADRDFLKRQLTLMPLADIGTFHSFAFGVLRRYFFLTDLEPGFKIGDETELSIMEKEAVEELYTRRFNEDYDRFSEFLIKYGDYKKDRKLKENMISLYHEMLSIPDYMDWARERTELLNADSPAKAIGIWKPIADEACIRLKEAHTLYLRAAGILEEAGVDPLYKKAMEDADVIAAEIEDLNGSDALEDRIQRLKAFVTEVKFNGMSGYKGYEEKYAPIKDEVAKYRTRGRNKIKKQLMDKFFKRSGEEYDEELRGLYPDTSYLLELLIEYEKIFRGKKAEKNVVSFDDAMHYAIEILKDEKASDEYRNKFKYIFIDEFQDSNMLQETIINSISRENNVFMVGDVKQSIYKFRLAEPEIFEGKYALYKKESEKKSVAIDLNDNFRSKRKVTETVNAVFSRIMKGYDENAALKCSIDDDHPGYDTELHVVSDAEISEDGDAEPKEEVIADLIRQNLGCEIFDVKEGRMREVQYRDIVVLSRGKEAITHLEKFLNNEGIPAYGIKEGGYFESVEVQVFVNLLRVIDNLDQDIPLVSVMRGPVFGFRTDEMAAVRIAYGEGSFYEAVKNYGEEGTDEKIRGKISGMLASISCWNELKDDVPLEELLRILLYDTGYFDYCSGLPMGDQRISNLRLIIEKAEQFEENNYSGLSGFLAYIEAMEKNRISVGEAKTVGENENVVRVMTVHKSKGLEFPIVIMTGLGKKIGAEGVGTSFDLHKDLAISLPHVNHSEKWHRKTLLQKAIAAKKTREKFDEEIRILYVAMTRAMDKLILTGEVKDAASLENVVGEGSTYLEKIYAPLKEMRRDSIIIEQMTGADEIAAVKMRKRDAVAKLLEEAGSARDEEKQKRITERLSFIYPYAEEAKIRSKYSVTELNGNESAETAGARELSRVLAVPDFSVGKREPTAAQMGTAIHMVMEKLDFRRAYDEGESYIIDVMDRLKDNDLLQDDEYERIDPENIDAFFRTDIGKRAALSRSLRKEKEFILQKEIGGVKTIVQGIIDCYFEEENGIVLIDYKNAYVGRGTDGEAIAARYREQVKVYGEALEAAGGKKVKEAYLYLFNLKRFISEKI